VEEAMKRAMAATAAWFLLMALSPAAWALGKGGSMFSLELTNGTADFADKTQGGTTGPPNYTATYISAYDHPELGVQGQYWRMMSDDYAVTLSAGWGFFHETDKPGQGAASGSPDRKFSINSFNVRLGGDRIAKVGERAMLYGGPGIEIWSGSAKFEPPFPFSNATTGSYTNQSTVRWGLSARLGGTMMIGKGYGLTAHVGGRYGYASVEENGAKATWWPSSMESSAGVIWMFGEK
jgi:hypothetical protein